MSGTGTEVNSNTGSPQAARPLTSVPVPRRQRRLTRCGKREGRINLKQSNVINKRLKPQKNGFLCMLHKSQKSKVIFP